jgi:predicted RNA-binding Zn-ribbon protein involved in translation (DUF1610 family)
MKSIKFSLKQNAIDSLVHGIEHFVNSNEPSDFKYAILHIAQSVELFLKERLAQEHFLLIYSKPEYCKNDSKTVTLEESLGRLEASQIKIDSQAVHSFKEIQKLRNQIQHYEVELDKKNTTIILGRTLKYLEIFLDTELNLAVENILTKEQFISYADIVYSYKDLEKIIQKRINELLPTGKERLDYSVHYCPNCGNNSIIYPNPQEEEYGIVECLFCFEKFDAIVCDRCGSLVFEKEGICHVCWDNYMSST